MMYLLCSHWRWLLRPNRRRLRSRPSGIAIAATDGLRRCSAPSSPLCRIRGACSSRAAASASRPRPPIRSVGTPTRRASAPRGRRLWRVHGRPGRRRCRQLPCPNGMCPGRKLRQLPRRQLPRRQLPPRRTPPPRRKAGRPARPRVTRSRRSGESRWLRGSAEGRKSEAGLLLPPAGASRREPRLRGG